MNLYKITNEHGQTYGKCQWGENVEYTASGEGDLCGPGWLHAYSHPLLAALLAPAHVGWWKTAKLWEADGDVGKNDGTKVGCTRLRTIREIPLPVVTDEQRVRFGIGSAVMVWNDGDFYKWANRWIAGEDRSAMAAEAARKAAEAATRAEAAAEAATRAEAAAAEATWAATRATTRAATWATESTWATAAAAVRAAEAAVIRETPLNLIRVAKWAVTNESLGELLSFRPRRES